MRLPRLGNQTWRDRMAAQWREQRVQRRMTVHIVKLCVGCDTVQDLKDWQDVEARSAQARAARRRSSAIAPCRRRAGARRCLTAASLYWVIRGVILVRQRSHRSQARRARMTAPPVAASYTTGAGGDAGASAARVPGVALSAADRRRRRICGWSARMKATMPRAMRADLRELRLIDF